MRRPAVPPLLALLLVLVMIPLSTPTPASGLTAPPSFQLVDYPTGQAPYNLTDFAWLPDGGLLTSGKDGTITYVPPGGDPRVLTKVPSVRALGDHGLLGFALANDYATSGRIVCVLRQGPREQHRVRSGGGVGRVAAVGADHVPAFADRSRRRNPLSTARAGQAHTRHRRCPGRSR